MSVAVLDISGLTEKGIEMKKQRSSFEYAFWFLAGLFLAIVLMTAAIDPQHRLWW